jgi:hypothetical protein
VLKARFNPKPGPEIVHQGDPIVRKQPPRTSSPFRLLLQKISSPLRKWLAVFALIFR